MLSAAHVLAMDAKNLLDVVDSIRIRYPEVDAVICSPPDSQLTEEAVEPNTKEATEKETPDKTTGTADVNNSLLTDS